MENAPDTVKEYLAEAYGAARKWHLPNGATWRDRRSVAPKLRTAGVVGGGTMGRGIAIALARSGLHVVVVEETEQAVENCKRELRIAVEREMAKGRFSKEVAKKLQTNLRYSCNLSDLAAVDLVIEAIFEDMKMKRSLFEQLNRICKPEAILATNTSSLDIDQIASGISNPSRVVGIHFFNPAHVVKTIEIVYGTHTSGVAVATAFDVSYKMKKVPVLVKNFPGFLFNRLLFAYMKQTQSLMSVYGLYPHHVDAIFTGFGLAMGPITTSDMNGLDVAARVSREQGWPMNPLSQELVKLGRFGRKTSQGYYKYLSTGKKVADCDVERMIDRISAGAKKPIRLVGDQDIIEFALFPMINEGFHCLDRGIVGTPLEIDIMFVFGLGWPIHTGGPMRWAQSIGYPKVVGRLQEMFNLTGDEIMKPAKGLLLKSADKSKL